MKDEWLRAALTDDLMVVELLFRLKQSSSDTSMPMSAKSPPPPPVPVSLCWGQRLPRSKLSNAVVRKDSTTTTRCSPTTPLSWSDGGYDESVSRAPSDLSSASRSKGTICTSEATAHTSKINKRSTRKRTFVDLKEKESTLLNERIHLKRKLASLHMTLNEQRARSENYMRFKFDLNRQSRETVATSGKAEVVVPCECNQMEVSTANHAQSLMPIQHHAKDDRALLYNSCRLEEEVETNKRHFVLPDLNMTPTDEEIAGEV